MSPKVEYMTVCASSLPKLSESVQGRCVLGWKPLGAPFVSPLLGPDGFCGNGYIQALTREVTDGPRIVCLCGSMRFLDAFTLATQRETLAGRIVLSVATLAGMEGQTVTITEEAKRKIDQLHFRKIEVADEILVLNVDDYVGASTKSEIEYARKLGKPVRWLKGEGAAS